ncbi:GDSL esterase/lipase [Morus notabilis]|uniref:GDSL esterase/lipase n=1 Tax=Morus notabilis TaxID=981085 RepID=W9QY06_9ROSA|nr:GDSL esterase/lipase At1g29670 [Morus notabilis]EXB58270.1 GDSL esterase/lipase [Morus notabilis]
MAGQTKVLVVLFAMSLVAYILQINGVNGDPQVPCFFIFGDSLVDNGNNNPLLTEAKVNYKPYGIDFGGTPTGRFNNGRTQADILGQLLGFDDFIPPYTTARGNVILKGVNYASGAAGIRDETGYQLGDIIPLNEQLRNHQITVLRITAMLRNRTAAQKYLNKCLYYVGMGNNDYLNNYFLPQFYTTALIYTPQQYAQQLIDQYRKQITRLYNLGARKVAIFGVGVIGCIPYAISTFGTNGSACVDRFNEAAQIFNTMLISLVDELNSRYTYAKFIYVNSFGIGSGDPTSVGFTVLNVGCCPVNNIGQCIPFLTPCQNRTTYVFWDSFHPTEAVNLLTASRSYTAFLPSDTYPIDIKRLAQLQL